MAAPGRKRTIALHNGNVRFRVGSGRQRDYPLGSAIGQAQFYGFAADPTKLAPSQRWGLMYDCRGTGVIG